jgi:DNA primase
MRFSEAFLTELKARVRLSDVIGRKVKLQKRGRSWVGLSPFSNEKTPSFYVHDDRGFYKCFSTQKSGDAISFVMETERLTFNEAVEKLANDAGLALPSVSAEDQRDQRRRADLMDWLEEAARWFEAQLRTGHGAEARTYLEARGFGADAWSRHRMGYAPKNWRLFLDHMVSRGAREAELIEAGLLGTSDEDGRVYGFFRDRVVFPILSPAGRVIAFGARTLDPAAKPKYLNSPDTPLFHKSRVLFRMGAAREALAELSEKEPLGRGLIVTEGYVDAIALAEVGIGTAVAPLGTALTEEQIDMLWRAGPEPILCFDGDAAGVRAAWKALDRALPKITPGRTLTFAMMPTGLDPDDLVRKHGADAMRQVLLTAQPLVEVLWRRELEAEPLDTPERRAGLEARLIEAANRIADPGLRKAYARELRDRYYWYFRKLKSAPVPQRKGRLSAEAAPRIRGFNLLARAIDSPLVFEQVREALCQAEFVDRDVAAIRDAAFHIVESGDALDRDAVAAHLRILGRKRAVDLLGSIPSGSGLDPQSPDGRELVAAIQRFAVATVISGESAVQLEEGDVEMMSAPHEARIRAYAADRRKMARWSGDDSGVDPVNAADSQKLGEALRSMGAEVQRRSRH